MKEVNKNNFKIKKECFTSRLRYFASFLANFQKKKK